MSHLELEKIPENSSIYCNRCSGNTRHARIWRSYRNEPQWSEGEESPDYVEEWIYVGWRCLGCESVTLEERYLGPGMTDEDGDDCWGFTHYPARKEHEIKAKYYIRLPYKLSNIYKETIVAYNSKAKILCAIGLRGLIEGVCVDRNIEGHNLGEKIENLKAILPENIVNNLHSFRFMGNTSAHELSPPDKEALKLAIEICNDLLNFLYELDYKTEQLNRMANQKPLPWPPPV